MDRIIREYLSDIGKKGGSIGGKAKVPKGSAMLSKERRHEIAMMGVKARLEKKAKKSIG